VAYAPEEAVRNTLDPGEREVWTGEPSFYDSAEAGDTTELKFDWYGGDASHEVEFVAD
jgi:hypothetical protein